MSEETKKAVAVKHTKNEVFISEAPKDIDFAQDLQEFGANYAPGQMAMPFLNILQAMSHEVTRGDEKYIKDAQPGQFFNTVTKELYDGEAGIDIVFGNFKESYIEWVPRSKGGGYVAEYNATDGLKATIGIDPDKNRVIQDGSAIGTPGNHLNQTHTRMGFVVSDDLTRWTPVIVSMASTQLGVSAQFNTRHKLLEYENPVTGRIEKGPPLPLVIWHVTTKLSKNDKGSWFSWNIEKKDFLHKVKDGWELYRSIRDFVKSSRGQQAMANAAVEYAKTVETSTGDEIPF